jgi:hypothetical protein
MAYSINQMIVDSKQLVVALDWSYANAEGTLSNQHQLLKPYGSTPLAEVTEEVATGWLKEQLQNTSADFDAAIAQRKQETEYAATLVAYVSNGTGAFQVYEAPEPEPEATSAVE